jgi:hypothetical protein
MTVVRQEQLRLRIPREHLNDYISLIKEYVPLAPAELIFNFDETGLSDWEQPKTKPAIIPIMHPLQFFIIQSTQRSAITLCFAVSLQLEMHIPLSFSLFIQKRGESLRRVSERTLI